MESAQRTRPRGPWSGSRPYLGFLYVGGPCGPLPVANRADGPCSHRKPEGGGTGTLFSISPTVAPGPTTGRGATAGAGYEAAENWMTRPGVGPIPDLDQMLTFGAACTSPLPTPCRSVLGGERPGPTRQGARSWETK